MSRFSKVLVDLKQAQDEVIHIQRIAGELVKTATVKETCELIVHEFKKTLNADGICVFLLLQPEMGQEGEYEMMAEMGCTEAFKSQWHRVPASTFPRINIEDPNESLFFGTAEELKREIPSTKELVDSSGREIIAYAPLVVNHKSIGVVGFSYNSAKTAHSNRRVIMTLVSLCAQGLERARLFERERAVRKEAEDANKAKTNFLAMMSHEIRTPIGAIRGFADLICQSSNIPETEKGWASRILKNAVHLTELVGSVLDISKIEAEKIEVKKFSFRLGDFIEDIKAATILRAEDRGISLNFLTSDLDRVIYSDPVHLRQVVINLVGNSIKFTPKHGRIDVLFDLKSPQLEIQVRDSGIGISEDHWLQIFEPFTQIALLGKNNGGGTGLGLSISKRLAKALGGNLFLLESCLGRGSTFVVKVDCIEHFEGNEEVERPVENRPQLDNLKFLLVDDSSDTQELVTHILSAQGGKVDIASNGAMGVEKALSSEYNLVIMDIQMPEMDGNQAVSELRSRGYDRPIVALTAEAQADKKKHSLERGFDDYLSKPIDTKYFVKTLMQLVGQDH